LNKEFWATGIHPLIPSALRPKQKNFVLHLIIKATRETIMEEKDKKMYASGSLHFRSFLAHPRLTAYMRFGSCRASTQIAPVGRNFSYTQTLYGGSI